MNHNPKNQWNKERARAMNILAQRAIYQKQKKRLGVNDDYFSYSWYSIALDILMGIAIGCSLAIIL